MDLYFCIMDEYQAELGFEDMRCDRCGHTWVYKGTKPRVSCGNCFRVLYTKHGREVYVKNKDFDEAIKKAEGKPVFNDFDVDKEGNMIPKPGHKLLVDGTEILRPKVDESLVEIILSEDDDI